MKAIIGAGIGGLLARLGMVGGLLWGMKPIYDILYNGRMMNTGYAPGDPTDYISFLFPLLCIGSLIVVCSVYRKKVRNSVVLLLASVILHGCFLYFEIYEYGSNTPFGFLFLFTSTLCMLIGSAYLVFQLKRAGETRRLLSWSVAALFWDNLLLIAAALLTGVLPEEATNPIAATMMVAVGWVWAAIGLAAFRLVKQRAVPGSA